MGTSMEWRKCLSRTTMCGIFMIFLLFLSSSFPGAWSWLYIAELLRPRKRTSISFYIDILEDDANGVPPFLANLQLNRFTPWSRIFLCRNGCPSEQFRIFKTSVSIEDFSDISSSTLLSSTLYGSETYSFQSFARHLNKGTVFTKSWWGWCSFKWRV